MGNRAPEDMLANNPSFDDGAGQAADTAALNRAIRADQGAGIEAKLGALLDESNRRQQQTRGGG